MQWCQGSLYHMQHAAAGGLLGVRRHLSPTLGKTQQPQWVYLDITGTNPGCPKPGIKPRKGDGIWW